MTHSFDIAVAEKYGINAAILLRHIYFWCEKNKANDVNYRDGLYWTYNSRKAFSTLFPYLSEKQVKTALDKLVDNGLIVTGIYNDDSWNRTLWYAVTKRGDCICQKGNMDDDEMSNAHTQNGKSYITDINADINADININNHNNRAREESNDGPSLAFTDDETQTVDSETLEVYAANNIVNMNGRNMEFLNGFRDKLSDDVIRYAIDLANRCCKSGVPTYNYVEKILISYVRKKITSVEQAQALERERDAERKEAANGFRTRARPRSTAAEESAAFWGNVKSY